jgi:hypothetical protein
LRPFTIASIYVLVHRGPSEWLVLIGVMDADWTLIARLCSNPAIRASYVPIQSGPVPRRGVPNGAPQNRCHAIVTALSGNPYIRRTVRTTIRTARHRLIGNAAMGFREKNIGTALAIMPEKLTGNIPFTRKHAKEIAMHHTKNEIPLPLRLCRSSRREPIRRAIGLQVLKQDSVAFTPGFFLGLSQEALIWASIKAVRRYFA